MTILIEYKDNSATIDLGDESNLGDAKFAFINILLPQIKIGDRNPKLKDFAIEVDHPNEDFQRAVVKEIKESIHTLYW